MSFPYSESTLVTNTNSVSDYTMCLAFSTQKPKYKPAYEDKEKDVPKSGDSAADEESQYEVEKISLAIC